MTFPQTVQDIKVELLGIVTAGTWTDVTHYVQRRENDGITITRGRPDEGTKIEPSKATLNFNNRDGRFSPRNPNGAYYRLIGRNTQIRISILAGNYRFWGEVSQWPVQQDITGTDVWVNVEAFGIMRRLGQGAQPLPSAMKRRMSAHTAVVGYWPVEDGDLSTSVASGLINSKAMKVQGSPDYASYTGLFVSSNPIAQMLGSKWTGTIPFYTSTTNAHFGFFMGMPTAGTTNNSVLARLLTGGTIVRWDIYYMTSGGGSLGIRGYDSTDTLVFDPGFGAFNVNGNDDFIEIGLQDSGADILVTILSYGIFTKTVGFISFTAAANQITVAKQIIMNPNGTMQDIAIGHIVVASDANLFLDSATDILTINAFASETAADRISRLCSENGITYTLAAGTASSTPKMGPMAADTLLNLLQECVDVDLGILYEPRNSFGLTYKTRTSMYNQVASATASVTAHEMGSLVPVPDDQNIRNDVTVVRKRGASSRITQTTGPLSTNPPPSGVGTYDVQYDVSLYVDDDIDNHASWRLHLGTIDEERFPQIDFNLANPEIVANATLATGLLSMDLGSRLVITNPPSYMAPENISQIVQGVTEFLSNFERQITANCSPESGMEIGRYSAATVSGGGQAKYSSGGSSVSTAMNTTTTTMSVKTASGFALWTTVASQCPFFIMVNGEKMTVTAIASTTSPQTFTVTRSVNGVVKSHSVDEVVALFSPARYAL
jgi:hypothetical protein